MKRNILTVTLNPAIDETISIKRPLRKGGFFADEWITSAGGKGVNVSRVLKTLGLKTLATGLAGGATGHAFLKLLRKEKIAHDFTAMNAESRVNLTIVNQEAHKIKRLIEKGPVVTRRDIARFKRKFSALIQDCRWVIFSGRAILGAPQSIYGQLIKSAQGRQVRTALDTSGKPLALGLQARPFLVKLNKEEAEELLNAKLDSLARYKKCIASLLAYGVKCAVISLAKEGVVGSDGRAVYWAAPPKIKAVNEVGCGDALLAGFIYAFEKGCDFKESLAWAVASGTAYTFQLQTSLLSKGFIEKIKQKVKVTKL